MGSPLISVILPVYNAEKYLNECIESIIAQEFEDFELIILPGTSADKSTEICLEWEKRDKRIRIIEQDVNNIGYARNKGIANASGKYIAFCDADDVLLPDYLHVLSKVAEDNNADLVECDYYSATEDLSEKVHVNIAEVQSCISHGYYERVGAPAVWKYLSRKDLWIKNNIVFPESKIMEDLCVYSIIFASSHKTLQVDMPLYIYRMRTGSLIRSDTNFLERYTSYSKVIEFMSIMSKRINVFSSIRNTLVSQMEHQAVALFNQFRDSEVLSDDEMVNMLSKSIKEYFDVEMCIFDLCTVGWGGKLTGILSGELSVLHGSSYIKETSFCSVDDMFGNQLKEYLYREKANVVVLDILAEVNIIIKTVDLMSYIKQWYAGIVNFFKILNEAGIDKIFVIHNSAFDEMLIECGDNPGISKSEINNILGQQYSIIKNLCLSSHFISYENISDLNEDYIRIFCYEKIMDIIHDVVYT